MQKLVCDVLNLHAHVNIWKDTRPDLGVFARVTLIEDKVLELYRDDAQGLSQNNR